MHGWIKVDVNISITLAWRRSTENVISFSLALELRTHHWIIEKWWRCHFFIQVCISLVNLEWWHVFCHESTMMINECKDEWKTWLITFSWRSLAFISAFRLICTQWTLMFWGMYCNCNWTCLCISHPCIQTITFIVVTGTVARRRRTYPFDVNDDKNLQHDNIESWGWTWVYNKFRQHSEQLLWWGIYIYMCIESNAHCKYIVIWGYCWLTDIIQYSDTL